MSKPSTIDQLPPEIRGEINRLRQEGAILDDIVAYLRNATPKQISRSALGRHVKKMEDISERIRTARAIAEGIAPTLANNDSGQLLNLNVELLQSATMRLLSATDDDGEDVPVTPSEAMALGKALEAGARAQKVTAERVLRIRQETAKAAVKEVEAVLKKEAPGLSAETVAAIRSRVLGVAG